MEYIWHKNRFEVHGVDLSETALQRCDNKAKKKNINLVTFCNHYRGIDVNFEDYNLFVLLWFLSFLTVVEQRELIDELKRGMRTGSYILVNGLTTQDPSYLKMQSKGFYYFQEGELAELFRDFDIVYQYEGFYEWNDKNFQKQYYISELIAQKR